MKKVKIQHNIYYIPKLSMPENNFITIETLKCTEKLCSFVVSFKEISAFFYNVC